MEYQARPTHSFAFGRVKVIRPGQPCALPCLRQHSRAPARPLVVVPRVLKRFLCCCGLFENKGRRRGSKGRRVVPGKASAVSINQHKKSHAVPGLIVGPALGITSTVKNGGAVGVMDDGR